MWKKKFKCANKEEYEIWGDFHSGKAQELKINFKMCYGLPDCKTEEEIKHWLSDMYIVMVYKHSRFDPSIYFDGTQINESRLHYVQISSQIREMHPFEIESTTANL